jgi:hypothetical protein
VTITSPFCGVGGDAEAFGAGNWFAGYCATTTRDENITIAATQIAHKRCISLDPLILIFRFPISDPRLEQNLI